LESGIRRRKKEQTNEQKRKNGKSAVTTRYLRLDDADTVVLFSITAVAIKLHIISPCLVKINL